MRGSQVCRSIEVAIHVRSPSICSTTCCGLNPKCQNRIERRSASQPMSACRGFLFNEPCKCVRTTSGCRTRRRTELFSNVCPVAHAVAMCLDEYNMPQTIWRAKTCMGSCVVFFSNIRTTVQHVRSLCCIHNILFKCQRVITSK